VSCSYKYHLSKWKTGHGPLAMTCLSRIVAKLSSRRSGFNSKSVQVEYVVKLQTGYPVDWNLTVQFQFCDMTVNAFHYYVIRTFYILLINIEEDELLLLVKTLHYCHTDERGLVIFVSLIMADGLCFLFFWSVSNQPFTVGKVPGKNCCLNMYFRFRD